MIGYILSAVKSFFGLKNDHRISRKRAVYRLDFDVSDDDDDESEYEPVAPKKRKLTTEEVEVSSPSHSMADWVKPMKGFSQSYYYSALPIVKKPEEPKTIVISDDSADECEVITEKGAEASWNWKSLHNSTQHNEYSSGRNDKSARRTRVKHKRKSDSTDTYLTQPQYTTPSVSQKSEHRLKNGTDQSMTNGHNYQEKSFSGRCEHVCSVHNKPSGAVHKKRGATAAECFRLEDKERYRQLLQQYSATTNPLCGMYGYNGQSATKSTPKQMFTYTSRGLHVPEVQVLRDQTTRRSSATAALVKEKLTETHQQYHTRSILLKEQKSEVRRSLRPQPSSPSNSDIEIIEAVAKKPPVTSRHRKSSRQTDSPTVRIDTEQSIQGDDSVVITKEVVVPRWKQTLNSMGGFEYSSPAWLQEWKKKLAVEREEKKRQIEAAKENAKTLEKSLETMVSKLHLSASEAIPEIIEEVFTLDEEQEEEVEPLPELTPEMEERIDDAFCPTPPDELLVEGFRLQIRRKDMETLQDLNWLNDEVINFYMNLLMERGKDDNMPSVYAVNTFFYPKLISGGHDALKRWTRKIDVFAHEIMLVPVHLGVHWCLAVVNFKDKTLIYYDSMGGNNNECLNALSDYLQAESLDKKKKPFDMTDWSIKNAKDIPQQMNSSDCGMFACKYAEYITRNAKITFKQEHMPYFRRRMVYEIITKRLL